MKFEPVTKLDKRNIATSKIFCDEVLSPSCDLIVIFPIYDQFEAIWKPDSGTFSLIVAFHLSKTENRIKKSLI